MRILASKFKDMRDAFPKKYKCARFVSMDKRLCFNSFTGKPFCFHDKQLTSNRSLQIGKKFVLVSLLASVWDVTMRPSSYPLAQFLTRAGLWCSSSRHTLSCWRSWHTMRAWYRFSSKMTNYTTWSAEMKIIEVMRYMIKYVCLNIK